jgi:dipicolinate synthase subunit B
MCLRGKQIGFALPEGHFSMPAILLEVRKLVAAGADVYPLFLATSDHPETDEQYNAAKHQLELITGREMLAASLAEELGETTGEEVNFDILVVAPCPGNFLAKLVNVRTTSVSLTKPVKYLQSGKPVVLALVTNGDSDHLLQNVQQILSLKSIFLVPFGPVVQEGKQIYLSRLDLLSDTVHYAIEQRQLEPMYIEPCWLPS